KKGKGKKRNPAPPFILHSAVRGKPELVVHGFDLTITARALAKLLAEKCDNLFVHNHKLVVVKPPDDDDHMPRMRSAGVKAVIIPAHKHCQPFRPKDGERPPVTLPDEVAELYLAMPEEWRLRPLTSFANGPMLRDDGTISCEKGYDVSTGVYIYNVPQITVP